MQNKGQNGEKWEWASRHRIVINASDGRCIDLSVAQLGDEENALLDRAIACVNELDGLEVGELAETLRLAALMIETQPNLTDFANLRDALKKLGAIE